MRFCLLCVCMGCIVGGRVVWVVYVCVEGEEGYFGNHILLCLI